MINPINEEKKPLKRYLKFSVFNLTKIVEYDIIVLIELIILN